MEMQYLTQNMCLINLVISTIFTSKDAKRKFSYDWSLISDHTTPFSTDYSYEDARVLLQLSLMVTNSNFDRIELNTPSWLIDTPIQYESCPLEMISKGLSNSALNEPATLAHVLYDQRSNIVFVVFSGTSNGCLATLDLDYLQSELTGISNYTAGIRGHNGMYTAYKSIRLALLSQIQPYLDRQPQIVITGHSLGGALSTLCAFDLAYYRPIHYSFAAPIFFNPEGATRFSEMISSSYRIVNLSDMVTQFPLPIMPSGDLYNHVGSLLPFQSNLGEYHRNHALAYMMEFKLRYTEIEVPSGGK
jgi:hypothetical protein